MRKLSKILGAVLLTILLIFSLGNPVKAVDDSVLEELNKKIEEYEQEIGRLQSQANTLSNQIAQFNAQIELTQLKIDQTKEKILLLGGRIDQLEGSLSSLTAAFSSRVVETYKMNRLGDALWFLFSSGDLNQVVSRYRYLQKIQEADRELMVRLQRAQDVYQEEKTDQEELHAELEGQEKVLGAQKEAKNQLLSVTKSSEKKYQQLLSEAKAQLAAFRRFAAGHGGATILQNQTECDSWGCYYNQRDSLWGNIGLGGSEYSVAEYGCLVTSVSMIASHYGKDIKPSDIAVNSNFFVPGTGYLYHSAEGMPFSLTWAPKDRLDSELNNGPVIAGLYSGPDHFIVILKKDGDNYIMHDPFFENGGNKPLTDKYSVSDISNLRLVSFN